MVGGERLGSKICSEREVEIISQTCPDFVLKRILEFNKRGAFF
jgi:hypothetical protein